jgi:hypothetical protein
MGIDGREGVGLNETLSARKRFELSEKRASLEREFENWRCASERGKYLEKHHTQIRAVTNTLGRLNQDITIASDEDPDGSGILALALQTEVSILAVHRLWEFFRAKLAIRYVPWFEPYLRAADELAWSCYQPVQAVAGDEAAKEPPLVFFNGGASPFTMPRGTGYDAEVVPGEPLGAVGLERALRTLPIPVIGVPWFQIEHVPDALVIGHEVGHDVEQDLGLGQTLAELIKAAEVGPQRLEAWLAWRSEVFADIYGTLATGPAFVGALVDFLADAESAVTGERQQPGTWGWYPSRTLRVLICAATLDRLEMCGEADELRELWLATYPTHAMPEFEDDVPKVVEAVVSGAYPQLSDGPLTTLLTFTPEMQEVAETTATKLLKGQEPEGDVRTTFAAARIAYEEDRDRYRQRNTATHVLKIVRKVQAAGTRGKGDSGPSQEERDARDRDAAASLRDLLPG